MMKFNILVLMTIWLVQLEAQESYPITFTHDGKTVYGTFMVPDGPGPFPTLIINPGSGANDRDGTLLLSGGNVPCLYPDLEGETLKPYKELAEGLVDSGYAVLRYDKLEYTYPTTLGTITFHKLWLPVESAINYVKTRSDVDTTKIVLIGHSEGSSLIPFISKSRTDVRALISIAGARTPFDSILAYQLVHFARICDGDTNTAKTQANQILEYFDYVRDGQCSGLPPLFGVSACVWEDYFEATDPVSDNYNLNNLPTLFIGLGLDINVPPAELIRFENEVNTTEDFWSIPGLIHYMTPTDDPNVSMHLIDTIVYWLRERDIVSGVSEFQGDKTEINVFPNPFDKGFNLQVPDVNNHVLVSAYNSYGQLIFREKQINSGQEFLQLNTEPPGFYFLIIEIDGRFIARKILKR